MAREGEGERDDSFINFLKDNKIQTNVKGKREDKREKLKQMVKKNP